MMTQGNKYILFAAMLGVMASVESTDANVKVVHRCTTDALSPAQAIQRVQWAWTCALKKPDIAEITSEGDLREYGEPWTTKNFVSITLYPFPGDESRGKINYSRLELLYEGSFFLPDTRWQDVNGTLRQYWERSVLRARPLYPSFGSDPNIDSGVQLYPDPAHDPADCDLYQNAAGSGAPSATHYVNVYCTASCYPGDRLILTPAGFVTIKEARDGLMEEIITLAPESTLDRIGLMKNSVYSYTEEARDATHSIVTYRLASGGELQVTVDHPVLRADGFMVEAADLEVGDSLLQPDGKHDLIIDIEKREFFGKVYNLRPATQDTVSNILIADGYLVGSSMYQNEGVEYMNRIVLGDSIPYELLPIHE